MLKFDSFPSELADVTEGRIINYRELVRPSWCSTALLVRIGYTIEDIEVGNVSLRTEGEHKYHAIKQRKNTINQHNHKLSSAWALWI